MLVFGGITLETTGFPLDSWLWSFAESRWINVTRDTHPLGTFSAASGVFNNKTASSQSLVMFGGITGMRVDSCSGYESII